MPETFRLPRQLAAELRRLARASPDEEICGLISGDTAGTTRLFPIANVASDRRRFFELDPKGQIDAMRAMRERGERLVAIYHSHPRGPVFPSGHDIEQHAYPEAHCLVITLEPPGLRAFRIAAGEAEEVELSE